MDRTLQIDQLEARILEFSSAAQAKMPPAGWIRSIRSALGMSLQQLARRMSITKQSILEIEQREKLGTITIKSLRETAKALDMKLVYGLVPVDGSLEALIERKAKELATQIVLRTSNSMKLEDQTNSKRRLKKAIDERAAALAKELPKILWD